MKYSLNNRGFTLVELVTSIGLFAIFLVIMTGVFSRFVQVQRHSIEQGALILEVQSVMELFIKEARTAYGSTFRTEDGSQVSFHNQAGTCVSYRWNTIKNIFERAENPASASGTCDSGDFTDSEYAPLTSKSIEITHALFDANPSAYTTGNPALESQGVITFTLTAKSLKSASSVLPLTVQNTVTSRQVNAYE